MAKPNLFIPRKEERSAHKGYSDDMREIEMWSQTIPSASSAGAVRVIMSVGNAAHVAIFSGIEPTSLTGGAVDTNLPLFAGDTGYSPTLFFSGTTITATIGGGGFYTVPTSASAYFVWQSLRVLSPSFTGPTSTIGVTVAFRTVQVLTAAATGNAANISSRQINIASQGSHNFVASDFVSPTIVGTDLTFASGELESTGGLPYITGWSLSVIWDTANTLTQA